MRKVVKKMTIKEVIREKSEKLEKKDINVFDILGQKYPENGEDYAVQLWYKTYKNIFAKCTDKHLDEDMETARLIINEKTYIVNIRTGSIITM